MPERLIAWVCLAPTFLLLAVFFFWPLVRIVLRSLNVDGDAALSPEAFTLQHYVAAFENRNFRRIFVNTLVIAGQATLICMLLAYPIAYFFSRLRRRTASILLLMIVIPFLTSILVRLYAFTHILGRNGPVNMAIDALGLPTTSLLFNRTGAVIGMVNYLLPYMILILYGSMARIDQSLVTAAKSLGATSWHSFRTVYWPLALPGLVAGSVLVFVLGLGFFLTPVILGGPRDVTMAVYITKQVSQLDWGVAAAMGVILLLITGLLILIASRFFGNVLFADIASGGQRGAASTEPLGMTGLSLLLAAITALVVLFLYAPLLVIVPVSFSPSEMVRFPVVGFSTRWYEAFFRDPEWWNAGRKSLVTAFTVGALATLLSLMAASVLRTARPALRAVALAAILAPLIVPAILTAIALFDVEIRLRLLGTTPGLILAHAALALPYAFIVISTALIGAEKSLEEAAWTLGATRLRAFVTITIALILPSIVSAFALSFLASWDEVVVAIFQTGIRKTLPVLFYSYLQTGIPPVIAAIGTVLIVLLLVAAAAVHLARRVLRRAPAAG